MPYYKPTQLVSTFLGICLTLPLVQSVPVADRKESPYPWKAVVLLLSLLSPVF